MTEEHSKSNLATLICWAFQEIDYIIRKKSAKSCQWDGIKIYLYFSILIFVLTIYILVAKLKPFENVPHQWLLLCTTKNAIKQSKKIINK